MSARTKPVQCVYCGFYSRDGVRINGHFMCVQCERNMLVDEERQYDEEDWYEASRLENMDGFQLYQIVE